MDKYMLTSILRGETERRLEKKLTDFSTSDSLAYLEGTELQRVASKLLTGFINPLIGLRGVNTYRS